MRLCGAVITAALLATTAEPTEAQRFRFSRLDLDDGLSQGSVYSLAQDPEGFLWVGTQNGLNRYDGRSFRSGWEAGGQPSPVGFGFVRTLFVDARGRLWVGVDAHGLHRFERRSEEFVPVRWVGGAGPPADSLWSVWDLAHLGERLVVATSAGVAFVEEDGDAPALRPWELHGLPADCGVGASAVWAASETELWIGTLEGCLLRQRLGARDSVEVLGRLGAVVRDIGREARGGVWVTSDGGGAFRYHRAGDLIAAPGTGSATREAWTVLTSAAGETWIATPRGLAWVPSITADTTWFSMGTEERGELPHDFVLSLLEDRQGVIWVGTWNGLARVSPFRHGIGFIPTPTPTDGSVLGGVVAIQSVDKERVRLAMIGGGLAVVTLDGSEVRHEPFPDAGDVYSLATGPDGDLWLATAVGGVLRRSSSVWRQYRAGTHGPGGSFDDRTSAISVDRTGTVWLGTLQSGLGRYDPETDRFEAFPGPGPGGAYAAPYIWPVVEDAEGALWMGANGADGGIHRLSPDRLRFSTFITASPERPNAGRVLTVYPADDGVVWFGTQGGGLGRLDPKSGEVRLYTDVDGLPHNNVQGILADDRGKLWVSTNGGLARFDPEAESFWVFQERSGIQGSRFFTNSALKLGDGRLLFGGPNGVTVIDPERITPRDDPPAVALTRFSVRGSERAGINHVTAQEGVALGPTENFFAIEFAALDFTDASQNAYRYMLDDLDPDWIDADGGNTASYTSVPPGRYTFRVQARNSEGVWNRAGLTIPILVAPPYYATWWFRLGVVALLASLLWAAYRARMDQLARVRALRLRMTSDLHDDIGANLSAIALKSELLQRRDTQGGRRQSSLEDIERLARETTQKVREMIWVVKEEHDTVPGLVERMRDAAANLLGGVIEHTFQVDDAVPNKSIDMELRQDVYNAFKEMLQNVLRHAQATHASIEVGYARGHLTVTVVDDGTGFVESQTTYGNGLTHMRRGAEKHRGAFELDTAPGTGTRVMLSVHIG